MTVERSKRRVSSARLAAVTRRLLDESTLFALATVVPDGAAHINTAYVAWSHTLELVWLSHPDAQHSRNIATNPTAAVAVYDSSQSWGKPDRGLQLFGSAAKLQDADDATALYAERFPGYRREDVEAYGGLVWETTEVYRPARSD